jgi:hypothetical protein
MEDDRLPLTRSLEVEVRTGFALPSQTEGLTGEALVAALSKLSLPQNQALRTALAAGGEELIASEPAAVLDWIDAVFARWHAHYSLDPELEHLLLAAKPLAAAFACSEDRFFTPGAHALHRLLDNLYEGFAGWSSDLGKTARPAVDAVSEVIQRCLQDFPSEPAVDHTLHLLEQKISGYSEQLERLDSGLIEREATAMAGTVARRAVGDHLSQRLGSTSFPETLSDFLGGDWFEAGVALVKNLGTDGTVWQEYCSTTELFVDLFGQSDSTRPVRPEHNGAANYGGLPQKVRQVLDQVGLAGERAQNAEDMLEYLRLRYASKQALSSSLAPVMLDGKSTADWLQSSTTSLESSGIERGQWYRIHQADGVRRLRLSGAFGHNSHLVFMDFAGARALRLSADEFANLLRSGEATRLDTQQTFSRALVEAAMEKTEWLAQQQAAQTEGPCKAVADCRTGISTTGQRTWKLQRNNCAKPNSGLVNKPTHCPSVSLKTATARSALNSRLIPIRCCNCRSPLVPGLASTIANRRLWREWQVRDLDKDSYIFTNREGIKLRELTVPQLVTLIERDMVDILERRTSFRDTLAGNAGQDRLSQFQTGLA